MYCMNCGVKLADTEKVCPLCQTRVYHPDLVQGEAEKPYPAHKYPTAERGTKWGLIILSILYLLPIVTVLLCDLEINGTVMWSGYVIGALLLCYVIGILPTWFRNPNPVIFVPCGFAALGLFLLYINFATGGNWFMSFAFPVTGGIGLIVTAVVTLMRYVPKGALYIFGGASVALGAFMLLVEFLMYHTFQNPVLTGWAIFPLLALVMLGGLLIFLAICRPAREVMERKFFI